MNDVVFRELVRNLPARDIRTLCSTDRRFNSFCKDNKDYIMREREKRRFYLVVDSTPVCYMRVRDWSHAVRITKERPPAASDNVFRDVITLELLNYTAESVWVMFHFRDNHVDVHRVYTNEEHARVDFNKHVHEQLQYDVQNGDSLVYSKKGGVVTSTVYDDHGDYPDKGSRWKLVKVLL